MYKASNVILKWPNKQAETKKIILKWIFFFHLALKELKIIWGTHWNTFGSRPGYTLTKPSQIISHSLNSPGHEMTKKDGSSPLLKKKNERWVHVNLLPDSFFSPKGPISFFLFFSHPVGQKHSVKHGSRLPRQSSIRRPTAGQATVYRSADIKCARELDETGLAWLVQYVYIYKTLSVTHYSSVSFASSGSVNLMEFQFFLQKWIIWLSKSQKCYSSGLSKFSSFTLKTTNH